MEFHQEKLIFNYLNKKVVDIKANINWIHQELDKVNDPNFIEAIKTMLQNRKKIAKAFLDAYNDDIALAEEDIEKGNLYSHDEVAKKIEEWGKR